MAPCHAFKPFSAALASFLHQTLALRLPFARHQTLLTPSAAPWASQTATTAPIPKLTDGTLPRLQTLLGSFGLIPPPNPCLKIALPQSCQSATSAPLYGIPKLTDGTLTLLGSFGPIPAPNPCLKIAVFPRSNSSHTLRGALGRPDCHRSTSLWHSETDGWHPATPSTLLGSFGLIPAPNPCLKIAVCPPSQSSHTLRGALGKPDCHHSTSLRHSETDGWHPATPSNASRQLGFIPAPNPCLQVACARHQTLLKPSAAPWAGQTATAAPLYGIPKLTDGTLPRLQTLLGSFGLIPAPNPCLQIPFARHQTLLKPLRGALGRADRHHSTSLCHSETGTAPCHALKP